MDQARRWLAAALHWLAAALARLLVLLVQVYKAVLSPLIGPCCRFTPSCSSYAVEAIRRHGCVRGTGLALWRLLRCNPFNPGGEDPVPGVIETNLKGNRTVRCEADRNTA